MPNPEQPWMESLRGPPQGEWKPWPYGPDIRGWTMRCGAFEADIRRIGKNSNWYLCINGHPILNTPDLSEATSAADKAIVKRVEAVLPAYHKVKARLDARGVWA